MNKILKRIKPDCKQFILPVREIWKLPKDKNYKLIDVGASEKYLSQLIPKNINYHSLDYCGEHDYIFNLDDGKLPIKDNSYDIVVCLETLEHTFYPHRIMKELLRIAKPGALFFLSMPNEYNFYCRLNFFLGRKTEVQETFRTTEDHLHIHNPRVEDIIRFFSQYVHPIKFDYRWYSRTSFHNKGFKGNLFIFLDKIIGNFSPMFPSLFSRCVVVMGKK